ncbi:ABC transporter substrate-binding protein [Streptomyces antimycoticus]|uniref:ABC transporter substrate-binding protein n=2 Tax=Streptomyces antimycoticus TaxID=68175 RepID=UPI0010F7B407|nr:extracellular solute-binding protein [Streptomyces antimycoticus]
MADLPTSSVPRRNVLRWAAALATTAPALAACTGMSTSGVSGDGPRMITTQFTPVDEARNLRGILNKAYPDGVSLVLGDASQLGTQIRSQADSGNVKLDLIAGLHGDFAQLGPDYLTDVSTLMRHLDGAGIDPTFKELATLGTGRSWYVPWCQAAYVVAARKSELEHLPSGADADSLTYDQYLDWAVAVRRANGGKPRFGLPAGPEGLVTRFVQGHLYPSFTGAGVTRFRSDDAVTMWKYLKDLWANTVPSSTNYDFMQEPLASGEVTVAWDHVSRLVQAPADEPDDWVMVPCPAGPKGRGYMAVVLGLGIPKGAADVARASAVIRAMSEPDVQIDLLRKNSFFPVVKAGLPRDLPPAVRLESKAVRAQQGDPDGILSLPPVGLGQRDGEMSKVYRDAFTAIVLEGADIRRTLDAQARNMQRILDEVKVPCWAPDPVEDGRLCRVG